MITLPVCTSVIDKLPTPPTPFTVYPSDAINSGANGGGQLFIQKIIKDQNNVKFNLLNFCLFAY